MKTLLILPPFNRLHGIEKGYFPLGLGYLAATLERDNFDVRIYNAEMAETKQLPSVKYSEYDKYYQTYTNALADDGHPIWQETASVLRSTAPDLVGISVMAAKYTSAMKITDIVKRTNPGTMVTWGGPHPTVRPDEVLRNPNVDFVVRGEGEGTFLELCKALVRGSRDFSDIKGLSYRLGGDVFHNVSRALIHDLDSVPFPGRHLDLRPGLYTPNQMAAIMGSRGCPYNCAYCASKNTWGRKVRYRTPKNILEEMIQISESYGVSRFFFWDDTFTCSRKWVLGLCNVITNSDRKFTYGINTRVDLVDQELLSAMKRAGLDAIDFGIETGSDNMLRLLNRRMTVEQILNAVGLCRQLDIRYNAYFMLGFPEETEEDMRQTIDLIEKIKPDFSGLSIFTPYPGTDLYYRAKELGLIHEPLDWGRYSHQSPENHFIKYVDRATFRKIVKGVSERIDRKNRLNVWRRRVKGATRHPAGTAAKILSRVMACRIRLPGHPQD